MNYLEKDLSNIEKIVSNIKKDEAKVEKLNEEISKRGLNEKVEELGKQYAPKIEEFTKTHDIKNMTKEEKAKIILEYKNNLSQKEQEKFNQILNIAKNYAKKTKKGGN